MPYEQIGPQQEQVQGPARFVQGFDPQDLKAVAEADKTNTIQMSEQLMVNANKAARASDDDIRALIAYHDESGSPTGNILGDGGFIYMIMRHGQALGMPIETREDRRQVAKAIVNRLMVKRQDTMGDLTRENNSAFPDTPGAASQPGVPPFQPR
jgi:hypothetical protein